MQFNPYRASGNPTAPSVSAGNLNQLLGMQQKNIGDAVNAFGNIGKISRTEKLNNLIAKGSLDGMSEQQAQQFLTGQAGGSLTEQGQLGINNLLGNLRASDANTFKQGMQEDRQKFSQDTAQLLNENQLKRDDLKFESNVMLADDLRESKIEAQEEKARTAESVAKLLNKNQNSKVQKQWEGLDGNMWYTTIGGEVVNTGEKFNQKKSGKGGTSRKNDAISKLGLSKEAEPAFRNLSLAARLRMLNDDGTLKSGISWVTTPQVRKDGKITKDKSGYWFDDEQNRKIKVDNSKETVKKKKATRKEWAKNLFS